MQSKVSSNVESIVCEWLEWLEHSKNFSKNTIAAYKADLANFLCFLHRYFGESIEPKTLIELENAQIRSWLASRRDDGISARSNARSVASVKNFFRYLEKFQNIKNHKVIATQVSVKGKKLPKSIAFEEIMEVINKAEDVTKCEWIALRNIALLYLLYGLGLRISEALSIKTVDLNNSNLKIVGKGGKERIVPMLDVVYQVIQDYLEKRPFMHEYLFLNRHGGKLNRTTIASALLLLRRRFNLSETITPHALRHSFAAHLLKNGVGIRQIQELLGHKSLSSTEIYTKLQPEALMEKYNQFSLRK